MSPDERVISLAPVRLPSTAVVPELPAAVRKVSCRPSRDQLFAMCVALLKENGGKVAVAEMQQKLQTRFHVSARLVDYGAPSMKELILQCPGISVRRGRGEGRRKTAENVWNTVSVSYWLGLSFCKQPHMWLAVCVCFLYSPSAD